MRTKVLPNGNLLITADNRDRSELAEYCRRGYPEAEAQVMELLSGGSFEFIRPEAIGALTDAPILTDDADYSDDVMDRGAGPVPHADAKVWWFPDYMIRDPWEELAWKGRVVFSKAPKAS